MLFFSCGLFKKYMIFEIFYSMFKIKSEENLNIEFFLVQNWRGLIKINKNSLISKRKKMQPKRITSDSDHIEIKISFNFFYYH